MKTITYKIMLAFLISLTIIHIVLASSGYNWVCLKNRESIPKPYGGIYTCFLSSGEGYCRVCANSSFWYAAFTLCDGADCMYLNSTPVQPQNLTFDLNLPWPSGSIITKTSAYIGITTNIPAKLYVFDNILGKETLLCTKCTKFSRSFYFKQGLNDLTFRAVNGLDIKSQRINYTLDSIRPSISGTSPKYNTFASGEFNLTYTEANVKNITLYYGNGAINRTAKLSNCPLGTSKFCSININLTDFDGTSLSYWFNITDIAGNSVRNTAVRVFVDKTPPVITWLNYGIKGRYVTIKLNVTEKNFAKIVYYDNNGRENYFCSYLSGGACSKTLYLSLGNHIIEIKVLDKAGNYANKSINFTI